VVEPDLGSSPVVPTSVADVAVTGTLVRPVAPSSTGVPEETVVPTIVESGAPTVSSTSEVPSTTLFVLEDPPPTPIDIEADEQLRVVLTGDSITDQVAPYLQRILSQAATIEHRHLWGTALCDWFADSGDDLGLEYLDMTCRARGTRRSPTGRIDFARRRRAWGSSSRLRSDARRRSRDCHRKELPLRKMPPGRCRRKSPASVRPPASWG